MKFKREDSCVPSNEISQNFFVAPEILEEIENRKKSFFVDPHCGNFYTKRSNIFCLGKIIEFSFDVLPEFWKNIVQNCCSEKPEERYLIKDIINKF